MIATPSRLGKWMALIAALLGWMFDGLEMGLFPLVAKPALGELLGSSDSAVVGTWYGIVTALFLVGAATGGVLFGWIGDRFGRVRAMVVSVLTYAIVSGLCGFAANAWQLGALRFVAALGMGGEWSLGVALVNELWPDRSRAFLAGLIGAAGNLGYLVISLASLGLDRFVGEVHAGLLGIGVPTDYVERLLANNGWRFMMMLGAVPALLTFLIRMCVPESARWEHERDQGSTKHWATVDLLAVLVGAVGACGIVAAWAPTFELPIAVRIAGSLVGFAVALGGYTYPAYRFLRRSEVAEQPMRLGDHDASCDGGCRDSDGGNFSASRRIAGASSNRADIPANAHRRASAASLSWERGARCSRWPRSRTCSSTRMPGRPRSPFPRRKCRASVRSALRIRSSGRRSARSSAPSSPLSSPIGSVAG